jgi:hypothetical protein
MRSVLCSIGLAAGILVFGGVQNASADINDTLEFTTSFPFTVGQSTVPAGTYTITPDDDNPKFLLLTGGRTSVFFQTDDKETNEPRSRTEVVFNEYDGGYVLKNIWVAGSRSGAESVTAEGELHMAKHGQSKSQQHVAATKKSR